MEPTELPALPKKVPVYVPHTIPIRIHKTTAKQLHNITSKCNKKSYGRKVKANDIILAALDLLTDEHLEKIRQSTYSSSDQLEIEFKNYCKNHGPVTKDEFLRLLLSRSALQIPKELSATNEIG
jgi:hypothetical protein